jgi:hypothetical protein
MASKLHSASRTQRDTAQVETVTVTTHVVHVDLAVLLRGIKADVMDNVVLMIATPSGRDKRVALTGNFLVEPHHGGLDHDDWN